MMHNFYSMLTRHPWWCVLALALLIFSLPLLPEALVWVFRVVLLVLIFAIIVTYHPDAVRVGHLVATLQRSNCRVIIVDNTERESKGSPSDQETSNSSHSFG